LDWAELLRPKSGRGFHAKRAPGGQERGEDSHGEERYRDESERQRIARRDGDEHPGDELAEREREKEPASNAGHAQEDRLLQNERDQA